MILLGNLLALILQLTLTCSVFCIVQPKPDVVNPEVQACRVQSVNQSQLEIFQVALSAYLCPPLLEHPLIDIAKEELLAVQKANFHLVESNVDPGIEASALATPVSLDLVAAVSLSQKCPQFFVENLHVNLWVAPLLYVLIDVLGLLPFDSASSKQVLMRSILLTQVSATGHWTWVQCGEVVGAVPELSLGRASIELLVEQELIILPQPGGTDEIGSLPHLLVGGQLILLSELSVHFELFKELLQVRCADAGWLVCLIRV